MQKYTKIKSIRISKIQDETLRKMKSLNVDVGKFIRDAISEKLQKEKHYILKEPVETDYFLDGLNEAIKRNEI